MYQLTASLSFYVLLYSISTEFQMLWVEISLLNLEKYSDVVIDQLEDSSCTKFGSTWGNMN